MTHLELSDVLKLKYKKPDKCLLLRLVGVGSVLGK